MRRLKAKVLSLGALSGLLCLLAAGVSAKECTDCHSGQAPHAPAVKPSEASVHASLECNECHTGVKVDESNAAKPHGANVRAVQCKTCHADQHQSFSSGSHSEKMKAFLEKKGKTSPAQSCLACHAADPHAIVKVKDPGSPMSHANTPATCLNCHSNNEPIIVSTYSDSVHGTAVAAGKMKAAVCTDCHGGHAINRSNLPNSSVNRLKVPQTCGTCHPAEFTEYTTSFHWTQANKGVREAPVCTDCHGEHNIRSHRDPLSTVYAGNITKTCVACHGSARLTTKFMTTPGGVEALKESFHGISSSIGDIRVANCSSCHGNHGILPRNDPRSSVNPANLGRTCGACHPGAEMRFINERVHTTVKQPSHWIVGVVRQVYIWLIILTIGGMIFHNLLDLRYKAMVGMPYHKKEVFDTRFSVNERIQHGLLALSFILLAVSGLARKFPESPFAWPFPVSHDGMDYRGWTHRGAAIAFLSLTIYHALYLLVTRRGREQFKAMRPNLQDALDAKDVMLKYLGFSHKRLTLPHYGYVEKAEYWALVWGTFIMTVTGLLLWFVDLGRVPLWVMDLASTIHFWEALLAVLAIMVWHGYWVSLDPEFYPLNLTWLIGRPRPASAGHAVIPVHADPPEEAAPVITDAPAAPSAKDAGEPKPQA